MNATRHNVLLQCSQSARTSRGMALVITLSAVVLLTVLVLAFFSRAQLNRQISYSSTNLIKSDILARSALDIIVGELRCEITDPNRSTGTTSSGLNLYQPKASEYWLPSLLGISGATGPLLKVSSSAVPIRPGGTITGSSITINSSSANGRAISSSRWYTSSSSPKLGIGAMPTWLFVTRASGVKTPLIANAKDTTHGDYVIGRFAYTVYDIGGIFDATVAGYPTSTPFVKSDTDIGLKASTSYVDLSLFGFSSSNIDKFIGWRNAVTSTGTLSYLEWSAGIKNTAGISNYAALEVARSGHRTIVLGDNTPLTRHDLIANPTLSGPLGSNPIPLTHFSRSLNSPCYIPASITVTNSNLGALRFPEAAPTITHYHDDGTTETYSVLAGDFYLQHRFSLAKIAWIGSTGPNIAAFNSSRSPAQIDKAIQDCFGLKWNVTNHRWDYVGNSNLIATSIKTLDVSAMEKREPNFFEMLKAGIQDGSLGRANDSKTLADDTYKSSIHGSKDLQILRIGACIIDNADANNIPTTIALRFTNQNVEIPVHGVEDLPYIFGISSARINNDLFNPTTRTHTIKDLCCVTVPILFNPHQRSSVAATEVPNNIRVGIFNGSLLGIFSGYPTTTSFSNLVYKNFFNNPISLKNTAPITIPSSSLENFRSSLKPVTRSDNGSTQDIFKALDASSSDPQNIYPQGFLIFKYPNPITYDYSAEENRPYALSVNNLIISLEYQDSAGWHIYDTLAGNEAFSTGSGIGSGSMASSTLSNITMAVQFSKGSTSHSNLYIGHGQIRYDPRTTRFGISKTGNFKTKVKTPLIDTSMNGLDSPQSLSEYLPFIGTPSNVYPGDWYEGGKQSWSSAVGNNVADLDGITRPADAWLDPANSNLYRGLSDSKRRPVILQRPFRSVAELGHVFRDTPGKTLNFFDDSSADKALLDLFSVCDEPTVSAGRVNLNTAQTKILQALFTGAGQAPDGSDALTNPSSLATAYNNYAFNSNIPTINMPTSIGDYVNFMSSAYLSVGATTGLDGIKYRREAVVRSIANNSQIRTWNLLIDVVAESGHYSSTATTLGDFIVEGERRYWLSVAIDRLTGKVIDQQLEPVSD